MGRAGRPRLPLPGMGGRAAATWRGQARVAASGRDNFLVVGRDNWDLLGIGSRCTMLGICSTRAASFF